MGEETEGWRPDGFLAEFDGETFDVEEHATSILKKENMGEEVARLTESLQRLDTVIQQHVCNNYTDLLSHAVASSELEQSLAVMSTHIQSLQLSTDKLRARVVEPFDKIQANTLSLARLQETTDILRRVIRILQLSKKLAANMTGQSEPDLAKAAAGLAEMSQLLAEDLAGLEVVEGEARQVRHWRLEVERQGEQLVQAGLEGGNHSQLGTGLQVFYNLGSLSDLVTRTLDRLHTDLRAAWLEGLDHKRIAESGQGSGVAGGPGRGGGGPGRAAGPAPGNMAAYRSSLWANMDTLLDTLHSHMVKVLLLQRLLCKKVDPISQQSYLSSLPSPGLVAASWARTTATVQDCLATAQARSNFVRQTLEGEYPKLVKLYTEFWAKLQSTGAQYTESNQSEAVVTEEMDRGLRESFGQFERAYLARSLSRLFDPINLMFGGSGGLPSSNEAANIFTVMASELRIARTEARLLDSVTNNVCKAVSLFCQKCEACVDAEASQVIGQPTPAQLQNIGVVNLLSEFHTRLVGLETEEELPGAGLVEAGQQVERLMVTATEPLIDSVAHSVEAILLTVHKEDFSGEPAGGDTAAAPAPACSLYMKELQTFLERIGRDFLSVFRWPGLVGGQLEPLAELTIRQFVLQASLVRPLGGAGAMRLASDCAQLEFALSSILGPSGVETGGNATGLTALSTYQLLRTFRSLLFLSPEDMASCPGLGRTVPYSTALHLLISRCPPALLASPAASLGWSTARYTSWLEDHTGERERLQLLQGALEAYVAAARARQDKTFIPQYPVLLDLLQRGLTANQY